MAVRAGVFRLAWHVLSVYLKITCTNERCCSAPKLMILALTITIIVSVFVIVIIVIVIMTMPMMLKVIINREHS